MLTSSQTTGSILM